MRYRLPRNASEKAGTDKLLSTSEPPRWRCSSVAVAAATMWVVAVIPSAVASPAGVPRSRDLLVPLSQVQSIVVGFGGGSTLHANLLENRTSPWVDHSRDAGLSVPCRHFVNEDEAFGSGWANFASTRYSGSSNIGVSQRIAVYPDADAAHRTFQALKTAAWQCHLHPSPGVLDAGDALTEPEPETLVSQYPDSVNGPGSVAVDAVCGQVLVEVGAAHFSTDPRIAQAVLALITNKVPTC